jgi:hypothetical protein
LAAKNLKNIGTNTERPWKKYSSGKTFWGAKEFQNPEQGLFCRINKDISKQKQRLQEEMLNIVAYMGWKIRFYKIKMADKELDKWSKDDGKNTRDGGGGRGGAD